jgi:hypothetical protein
MWSQQPQRLQQQVSELTQQVQVVQARAAAKEASSRKYKEAVRAFKVRWSCRVTHTPTWRSHATAPTAAGRRWRLLLPMARQAPQVKLQERDEALSQRQAQVLELHTELSQLQRLLKQGPFGGAMLSAAAGTSASGGLRSSCCACGSPVRTPGARLRTSRGGSSSAEDAVAAATDGARACCGRRGHGPWWPHHARVATVRPSTTHTPSHTHTPRNHRAGAAAL